MRVWAYRIGACAFGAIIRKPGDWPWLSYRWYAGVVGVELKICGYDV